MFCITVFALVSGSHVYRRGDPVRTLFTARKPHEKYSQHLCLGHEHVVDIFFRESMNRTIVCRRNLTMGDIIEVRGMVHDGALMDMRVGDMSASRPIGCFGSLFEWIYEEEEDRRLGEESSLYPHGPHDLLFSHDPNDDKAVTTDVEDQTNNFSTFIISHFEFTLGYSDDGRVTSIAFNQIFDYPWPELHEISSEDRTGTLIEYSYAVTWVRNNLGPQEAQLQQICEEMKYNLSNGYHYRYYYAPGIMEPPEFWTLDTSSLESWQKCRDSILARSSLSELSNGTRFDEHHSIDYNWFSTSVAFVLVAVLASSLLLRVMLARREEAASREAELDAAARAWRAEGRRAAEAALEALESARVRPKGMQRFRVPLLPPGYEPSDTLKVSEG